MAVSSSVVKNGSLEKLEDFTPREYQVAILEEAKKSNCIACLGTGTGKTFIAVMLMKEMAEVVRKPFDEGGKRTFFLVPTVPLVTQQAKVIEMHTDLKVGAYYGDLGIDNWSREQWLEEFRKNEVLVMTAEICRIILDHNFLSAKHINLLIIDECHRAQGDHPYRQAMKCLISKANEEMPRIFGLSASLINSKCKPSSLAKSITELEHTLNSKVSGISDVTELRKYGTDPDEIALYYHMYKFGESPLYDDLSSFVLSIDSEIKQFLKTEDLEDEMFFTKPVKNLRQLKNIMDNLGRWCAYKVAELYLKEIKSFLTRSHGIDLHTCFKKIESFLEHFMEKCKSGYDVKPENRNQFPHRLQRLLELFASIRDDHRFDAVNLEPTSKNLSFENDPVEYAKYIQARDEEPINMSCIIFVEQRIVAYVLQQWLLEVTKNFPGYEFVRPAYVVGHGAQSLRGTQTGMPEKIQQATLRDFRSKKYNVLISTSVLEEGMDIQQCNVVVRFDLPKDFRAFIQSKGRARARNSIYLLMVQYDSSHTAFWEDITNYKAIEKLLLTKCLNRNSPKMEETIINLSDDLLPPYMPYGVGGARITLKSAISLINRYCSQLPKDMATTLRAKFQIEELEVEGSKVEYKCKLRLPINSPLKKVIEGAKMKQKKLAKMAAALEACKLLHELGEMNEDLVPISTSLDSAIEEEIGIIEEEIDAHGFQPGTKKRRQLYSKKVPIWFKDCQPMPAEPCFLHIIKMKLTFPLPKSLNPRNRPLLDPAAATRCFALLSLKSLPQVCPFPIFSKWGTVQVSIETACHRLTVSKDEIKKIEEFHKYIFADVLWIAGNKTFCPDNAESCFYIVPVDKASNFAIDWTFMKIVKEHMYNTQKLQSKKTADRTVFSESLFKDAMVIRMYSCDHLDMIVSLVRHVVRIARDKSPKDSLDNLSMSYKEFYHKKYCLDIKDDEQPLLETVRDQTLSVWKPLYTSPKQSFEDCDVLSRTKEKHKNYREYLVPELSFVHPFPVLEYFQATCLPAILFRLSKLLLAEELRQSVIADVHAGSFQKSTKWPAFNFETSDAKLMKHLVSIGEIPPRNDNSFHPQDILKQNGIITSFEQQVDLKDHPGPPPSLIFMALTTKGAGDEFDMERLEMIGDSFLKYAMSVKTYMKYPDFDEGKLTKVRIALIRNLHLYQCGKRKKIPEYLHASIFDVKNNFLPPCYTIEETVNIEGIVKKFKKQETETEPKYLYYTSQIVPDKSIADSVEALIGAYLLSCGQEGALRFMHWLGLNPFHTNDECLSVDTLNWPPKPPNPIVNKEDGWERNLTLLQDGLDRFENILGYKFNNIAYLVQAFTHPSYTNNCITDCYQRLEFLGDAVLDYLITRQLYEDPLGHSPGKLTDLRSALVNNIYFANLVIKFHFNEFLKILSPTLFKQITHFISSIKESEEFKFFEEYGYFLEEVECIQLEEVEVPKALGDIFESVAGAVYLDSGMSLDTVWKIFFPMIKSSFEHLSQHVPINPVRELYERVHTKNVFGEVEMRGDKAYIVVKFHGREFVGVGPNKKVAKRSAAKRALASLKD